MVSACTLPSGSSDTTSLTSVINTRPSTAGLSSSSSGVNPSVVAGRSTYGTGLVTGSSLSLGNVLGVAGVVNVPVVSGTTAGGNVDGVMKQLTQLVQTQTEMVAAQTRAMSAQSLPPMSHYSGEGNQPGDDSFEKWLQQIERAS